MQLNSILNNSSIKNKACSYEYSYKCMLANGLSHAQHAVLKLLNDFRTNNYG